MLETLKKKNKKERKGINDAMTVCIRHMARKANQNVRQIFRDKNVIPTSFTGLIKIICKRGSCKEVEKKEERKNKNKTKQNKNKNSIIYQVGRSEKMANRC